MEDQIKVIETFLLETGISSKLFYCVNFWTDYHRIDVQAHFDKDLAKKLMKYSQGILGENGFIGFTFMFMNQEFKIVLT
jgi:hypothetical protein